MKKLLFLFFIILMMPGIRTAYALDIDPILVDKPNPFVYECSENMFMEIPKPASIFTAIGEVNAADHYFFVKAEVLYLEDGTWDGIDESSFVLKHINEEEQVELFPLNYMMTARESLINEWPTFSEPLFFGWLLPINLVFDVPADHPDGWSLLFRPAERGGDPVCEIEIPLKVGRRGGRL